MPFYTSRLPGRKPLAAALFIVGLLLLALLVPTAGNGASIQTIDGEAHIAFSATPTLLFLPGDCVDVRWQVDNIREVFINQSPVIGEGQQNLCIDPQHMPALRVKLQDGTLRNYTLAITILAVNPLFWLAVVFIIWGLLTFRTLIINPLSTTIRSLRASTFVRELPRRLLLTGLGILVACVLLEFGLRFYYGRFGSREDKIKYLMTRDEINNLDSILIPMPYVNYIPSPTYTDHNSLGYRGPDVAIPKPDGVYRIVALGGSTTYSSATTSADSYPSQLQTILRDDYGYANVEVVNGGFIGYTSWETLVNFEFRVLELEPDMILLYEGVNDITPREQISVDCYRGHNPLRGLNPARGFWIERDAPLSSSALYRLLAINLHWMPDPSAINSAFDLPKADCQNDALPVEQRVADNPPVYFERNLRSIIAIAQANNIQPVFSTWAYYLKQDRPEYWRKEVDENNVIVKQVAESMNVPLYDLITEMPLQPEYWSADGIHLFPPGTHEQAEEYAAFLDDQNLLPKTGN